MSRPLNTIRNKIGDRINHFVVVGLADFRITYRSQSYPVWRCLCDCGTEFFTSTHHITRKKSCGCKQLDNENTSCLSPEERVFNKRFNQYKQGAKRRNIDMTLGFTEFIQLCKSDCYYCGTGPSHDITRYRYKGDIHYDTTIFTNGIDRIDSSKGYVSDNCVPCCSVCNRAKRDMQLQDFINWIVQLKEKSRW
jgi:hypothetical protein